jgi:hypothetical protein
MLEAGNGPKDMFLTAIRRDDLPAADRGWDSDGDGLFWFVLLDNGVDSVRGCCLKKSAYVPLLLPPKCLPVPVVWAGAAAKRRYVAPAAQVGRASERAENLIHSPKHKKEPHSLTTLPPHRQHKPFPTRLAQIGLLPWQCHRRSVLAAGPSREGPMGPRAETSPWVTTELQLAEPAT